VDRKISTLHDNIKAQQEEADKKQAESDKRQAATDKNVATLRSLLVVFGRELNTLKIRLDSEKAMSPSVATFSVSQPPVSTKKTGKSRATLNPPGSAESGDKGDDESSPVHGSTDTDDAKRPASSQSEAAGNDEDSSSDDEDFKKVEAALRKKK